MPETFAIVGAGHCAGQAAISLRRKGFGGRVVMIGEEPYVPYERPPLSKKFLAGEIEVDRVYLRPPEFYPEHDIDLRLGTAVVAIDPAERRIDLAGNDTFAYDKALIATGSRPRKLDLPGADLPGVCYLRNIADVEGIRDYMAAGARMVVIGGGYIGLEVAAVGAQTGMRVVVLEAADRILNRVTAPDLSAYFTRFHESHGTEIRCDVKVTGFYGNARVTGVRCADTEVPADVVVVGIGIVPNVEIAADAGLTCGNGIVVDEQCRTNDPNIYAAGDCTNHPNPFLRRRLRLESVQNALAQAQIAAANMTGGAETYGEIPWFWSDQHDLKLQIVGLSAGYDQTVLRGDMASGSFAVFYLKEGCLIAVDAVNSPREFMACRRIIPRNKTIPPEQLADTSIPMQKLV